MPTTPGELKRFYDKTAMPRWGWLPPALKTGLHEAHGAGLVTTEQLRKIGSNFVKLAASKDMITRQFLPKVAVLYTSGKEKEAIHALLHHTESEADLEEFILESPAKRRTLKILGGLGAAALVALAATRLGTKTPPPKTLPAQRQKPPTALPQVDQSASAEDAERELTKQVNSEIEKLKKKKQWQEGERAIVHVQDCQTGETIAQINAGIPFMAASLSKPFAMLAAYHVVENGKAPYPKMERDIAKMFLKSNNPAFNRLVEFAGGEAEVTKTIQRYGFGKTVIKQKIPTREEIPTGGDMATKIRDNKTTASDLVKFLEMIRAQKLISAKWSAKMKGHMDKYKHSRLVSAWQPGITSFSGKTGVVLGFNGEATTVTVKTPNGQKQYHLVLAVENPTLPGSGYNYTEWSWRTSDNLRALFRVIHPHMLARLSR